jgi:membrane protease YdiL (CAAX protease family)
MPNKFIILLLALFTILGFSAGGIAIIHYFQDISYQEAFKTKTNLFLELGVGLAYGFVAGLLAWKLICSKVMRPIQDKYGDLIGSLKLNMAEIIFISCCAGIGEEVLFRAGIQPFLGVWLTSIGFVAIHGYLHPKNWRISVYGALMTLIIVGIGYMFRHLGLTSAMAAHTMIDIVLLYFLTFKTELPPHVTIKIPEDHSEFEEEDVEPTAEDFPSMPTTPE